MNTGGNAIAADDCCYSIQNLGARGPRFESARPDQLTTFDLQNAAVSAFQSKKRAYRRLISIVGSWRGEDFVMAPTLSLDRKLLPRQQAQKQHRTRSVVEDKSSNMPH
jgi:hypothetical protein